MLADRLQQDMNEALKAREAGRKRLAAIRLLRAALANTAIDKRSPLTEDEALGVLAREASRLEGDIAEYRRLGRVERADELQEELLLVRSYLPAQLTAEEILQAVRDAVAATGAAGPADMGKVMKVLMPEMRGRADGKTVSELVKKALAGGG
ncbi:MAG: GatB/YqeY domain-containing protein [Bacillota bacterium]|nr:GatB/YqeY domain-containing protein [Bacillota bacterium]